MPPTTPCYRRQPATAAAAGILALLVLALPLHTVQAHVITGADGGNFRPNLNQNSKSVAANCASTYIIQSGDTCVSIATDVGITVAKLKDLNTFLDCSNLQADQLVCTQVDSSDPLNALGDMSNCITNYTILADDSCEGIASDYDLTVTQLLTLNEYLDCVDIVAGTSVCVAGYADNSTSTIIGGTARANATSVENEPVDGCSTIITASSGASCTELITLYSISATDLYNWNTNLDCLAIQDGERICVGAASNATATHASSTATSTAVSSSASSSLSSSSSSSSTGSSVSAAASLQADTSTTSQAQQTTQQQQQQQTTTTSSDTPTTTSTTEQAAATTTAASSSSGSLSDSEQETLDKHNSYRSNYGIASLAWDSSLASEASSYASYLADDLSCELVHSGTSGEGENLLSYGATAGAGTLAMYSAVDSWMTEDPSTFDHASQVLWAGSTTVGCAISTNTQSDGSFCQVVVCRYVPQGNIEGETYSDS
ncbi:Cuticle-degrading protease [Cladochytrium tenue]|nr:Cuticle-degrading protease [Cladochytrium tenue]